MAPHLILGTVTLDRDIFRPKDLFPLLGQTTRGSNRVMPGAYGQRPTKPVRDQIDVSIEWYLEGRANTTGTPTQGGTGLLNNLGTYKSAFMDQGGTTGLIAATLVLQNGNVTSNVQCWDWSVYWTGPVSATVLTRIVVPSGVWT